MSCDGAFNEILSGAKKTVTSNASGDDGVNGAGQIQNKLPSQAGMSGMGGRES